MATNKQAARQRPQPDALQAAGLAGGSTSLPAGDVHPSGRRVPHSTITPPSTLSAIFSGLSGIASSLAHAASSASSSVSGAQPSLSHHHHHQQLHSTHGGPGPGSGTGADGDAAGAAAAAQGREEVVAARFQWVDWAGAACSPSPSPPSSRLLLLLGYDHGLQVWDVSDHDLATELLSLRAGRGRVAAMQVAPTPPRSLGHGGASDPFKAQRPLISFLETTAGQPAPAASASPSLVSVASDPASDGRGRSCTTAHFLSLATKQIVHSIDLGSGTVDDMRINTNGTINLGTSIRLFSLLDFSMLADFADVHASPLRDLPVFDQSTRLIAYTTTTPYIPPVPQPQRHASISGHGYHSADPADEFSHVSMPAMTGDGRAALNATAAGAQAAGEVATKVAKEIASGVKVIGEYGYHAISNYFASSAASGSTAAAAATGPRSIQRNKHSLGIITCIGAGGFDQKKERKREPQDGVVVLRNLPAYASFSPTQSSPTFDPLSIRGLFKPHSNPVGIIRFDPSETRMFTASVEGTTVYGWDLTGLFSRARQGNSRGSNSSASNGAASGTHSGNGAGTSGSTLSMAAGSGRASSSGSGRPPAAGIPQCIFRCERGYTTAVIQDLSLSLDGRWLSVSTASGTTHVFHTDFSGSKAAGDQGNRSSNLSNAIGNARGRPASTSAAAPDAGRYRARSVSGNSSILGFGAAGHGPATASRVKKLAPIARLNARTSIDVVKRMFTGDAGSSATSATSTTSAGGSATHAFMDGGDDDDGESVLAAGAAGHGGLLGLGRTDLHNGRIAAFLSTEYGSAPISSAGSSPTDHPPLPIERQRLLVWDPAGKLSMYWIDLVPVEEDTRRASASGGGSGTGGSTGSGLAALTPAMMQLLSKFPKTTYTRALGGRRIEYRILMVPVSQSSLQRDHHWRECLAQDLILGGAREDLYQYRSSAAMAATAAGGSAPAAWTAAAARLWPSEIETTTCSDLRIPLWMDRQCTMQVYQTDQATRSLVALMDPNANKDTPAGHESPLHSSPARNADSSRSSTASGTSTPQRPGLLKPRPSFSDLPPTVTIAIVPYTPTPYGERKGLFPRVDGGVSGNDTDLEEGILSAMGDGLDMPVGQQSLLDAFFVDEEGYHVITSSQSIPSVGGGGHRSAGNYAATSASSALSTSTPSSLLGSAWDSAKKALFEGPSSWSQTDSKAQSQQQAQHQMQHQGDGRIPEGELDEEAEDVVGDLAASDGDGHEDDQADDDGGGGDDDDQALAADEHDGVFAMEHSK
ncbi:hypothetical protein BC831DRAFT_512707 [Entophlyctis helioformis]|nr:hypothetical protein BC831DRAFT_512707 [Entophlyctis helioformis]